MAETVLPPSADARETPQGVIPELVRFAGSFGRHVQGLLQLAGLETKEAALVGLRLLILLVAAIVCAIFGYVLALFFVAFLAGDRVSESPGSGFRSVWPSCILLRSRFARFCARNCLRTPVFKATAVGIAEGFRSDEKVQAMTKEEILAELTASRAAIVQGCVGPSRRIGLQSEV